MASTKNPNIVQTFSNLETFSLIWLDAEVNATEENKQSQKQLRAIINYLKTFKDPTKCETYIKSASEQDRIILIVSGRLGRIIVPNIHNLKQLSSIYIYCRDKAANEQWSKEFVKVRGVHVHLEELIYQIKIDQKYRSVLEEPMIMNIYSAKNEENQSTTELNGHFIHFLLLIDVLIRIKPTEDDKKELIKRCREEYQDNDPQLSMIREFESDYIPRKALWWYTRDSFVYNMLNKALRTQNTELLYLFRFLIHDICELLKSHQCQEPIRAFRFQPMSNSELKTLQNSIENFISINSFFSTSARSDIALKYAIHSTASNDLHRVLFGITADPRVVKSKPFAAISSLSYFSQECEILFMVGCIFRLKSVRRDENNKLWLIEMQLADDGESDLKKLFDHLKNDYGGGEEEVNLQSFGDVLRHMGKYDLAKKVYTNVRRRGSGGDTAFYNLCFSLGMTHKAKNDFDRSLHWFQKGLRKKLEKDPTDYVYIAGLYCAIGNIHLEKHDYDEALKSYNKAMEYYEKGKATNCSDIASLYHGYARIQYSKKDYSEAFNSFRRSLIIQQRHLPDNHPDMAINHSGIGDIYRHLNQCQDALIHYQTSLEIRKKSLPPDHSDIASSYQKIGMTYDTLNNWTEALKNYQTALVIYKKSLSPTHPSVIKVTKSIHRVQFNMK